MSFFYNEALGEVLYMTEDGRIFVYSKINIEEELEEEEETPATPPKRSKSVRGGSISEEDKKAKKREYMRTWLAKKKAKKEKLTGKEVVEQAKIEIEEQGLPIEIVNKFGRTVVEVVLNEKNRGIGYTADEIFEQRDKRLHGLNLSDVEEICDALSEAGL